MAVQKCIVNNSVCVSKSTTDIEVFTPRTNDTFFGIWIPAQYLYGLKESTQPWEKVDRHNRSHIDVAETVIRLNKLRWEYGFNVISLGPDDFFDPANNWSPFLLLEAFNQSDWEWRDVFLTLGNGCLEWAIKGIQLLRSYTHNQRFFAIGIDEPLLKSKAHKEHGVTASNVQWCLEHHYPESAFPPPRLSQIAAEVHQNGDTFYISDYWRFFESLPDVSQISSYMSLENDLYYADGLIFNAYEDFSILPDPKSTLPHNAWGFAKALTWLKGKDFGVWIANSCTMNYYEHEQIGFERTACQKDYFNTLFRMANGLKINRVFLYTGDLAPELANMILLNSYQRTFGSTRVMGRDRTGEPRTQDRVPPEPELTEAVLEEIMKCPVMPSLKNGYILLDRCRAFLDFANAVFWRRMDQLRYAALEEGYIRRTVKSFPTGQHRYCVDGPTIRIGDYSVIDCSQCSKWSSSMPKALRFCPSDLPLGGTTYFVRTTPTQIKPLDGALRTPPQGHTDRTHADLTTDAAGESIDYRAVNQTEDLYDNETSAMARPTVVYLLR
jgi:hypothetical protein